MSVNKQAGLATVEFAVVAAVLLTVIIGVIDISRLYFSAAALNEATRRGVRVAVVCPIDDPAIAQVAVFNEPGNPGDSPIIGGLRTSHIDVLYLDEDGVPVADPAGAGFLDIDFVRVRIDGFQLRTVVPGLSRIVPTPDFAATLPRESLGIPREGVVVPC